MVEWAPPSGSCQFSTSLDFSCLLTFQETLKDQEVGLTHASFKLLLLPWVLKYMRFFVSLLQDSLCFPQPTGSPESQMFWGLVFPVQDPRLGSSLWGFDILLLGENLGSCWRRTWQPTPVFLPAESHGQGSLAGYRPWGLKESETTDFLQLNLHPVCGLPNLVWVSASCLIVVPYTFDYRRSFLLDSRFSQLLLCKQL